MTNEEQERGNRLLAQDVVLTIDMARPTFPVSLNVCVRNGVVTLSGTVADASSCRTAEARARQTPGVTGVNNMLVATLAAIPAASGLQ